MANRPGSHGHDRGGHGGTMRPVGVVLAALLALLPDSSLAGAWPRDPGRTFLSFGTEIGADGLAFASLYAERGLPRRWTAVLDVGGDPTGGDAAAALTLRIPVEDGTGPNRFALSFGSGVVVEDGWQVTQIIGLGQARPFARVGAHWGRGLEIGPGTGWVGLDGLVDVTIPVVADDPADHAWKLDATLGINRSDRLATVLQVQMGGPFVGDAYVRVQGTVVRSLGPSARIEAGAIVGLAGDDTRALKAGVWLDF